MIDGLQLTIPRRMILIRIALTFSLVISILLSFNLWAGERTFPYTPLVNGFENNQLLNYLLISTIIICWLGSLFFRWHRLLIFSAIVLSTVLVLGDLNRLQHWFYIYSAMMVVFVFYNGRVDDSNKFTAYFIILQIIVASVYFFCGISQLNQSFVDSEFLNVIAPLESIVSERQFLFFKKVGVFIPYVFVFIGMGLIISPIRYLAITLAMVMHATLLILLFPSSYSHNYALWFSNLTVAVLLILLFSGRTKQRYFSPAYLFQMPLFYATVILFVILPFSNSNGFWPDYLSSNFKSGRTKKVTINIQKSVYQNLPLYEKTFCKQHNEGFSMDYELWCKEELRVDCYPEKPIFNSIYKHLHQFEQSHVKETELALRER